MRRFVNFLSLSRIVLGLVFSYIVLYFNSNPLSLVFIFILVVLSDYFDGVIARKYSISNDFGGRVDVISDFIFIFLSSSSLVLVSRIPFWYLFILVFEILEFFLSSHYLDKLYYDDFGHYTSLMFYAFPIFIIVFNFPNTVTLFLSLLISFSSLFSSYLRFKYILSVK